MISPRQWAVLTSPDLSCWKNLSTFAIIVVIGEIAGNIYNSYTSHSTLLWPGGVGGGGGGQVVQAAWIGGRGGGGRGKSGNVWKNAFFPWDNRP